ncbi:uncharacterized protein BX664DRAFT_368192 [Halteromyces radiatus]|uniref:uncharacterized protein n=1 Tax=Halteromyces radiatus TaxID=101107 RepID=UPI00221FE806|nr:uncharacterized protein BX664DRAFT_368192 [Halteromyces radiatus]KAI8099293.1 hypothetical protein BX664DRAFT_368192 [Halteromyces radiatus]
MHPHQLTATNRIYLYCGLLSLGGFLFGYNFNVVAIVVGMPLFQEDIGEVSQIRIYSGAMALGAAAGAVVGGILADRMGRKQSMIVSGIVFLVGSFFQTGGNNQALILVGRVITGLSVGVFTMLVPLYISEIAPKNLRGRLITIHQFAITVGILCASWICYGTIKIPNDTSWRLPIGIQMIPCLVMVILVCFIPESPRYLMYRHHDVAALNVLAKIHGDGSASHPEVYMEYISIKQTIAYERTFTDFRRYSRLLSKAPENNGRRLLLGILTQSFQQLTGINPILVFATHILQSIGLSGAYSSLFANAIGATVNTIFTIPAIFFIDRIGRRRAMLIGSGTLCICLIIMSVLSIITSTISRSDFYDSTSEGPLFDNSAIPVMQQARNQAIAFIAIEYFFVIVFAVTWGPLGWIYISELYGQGVRAKALSISTSFGWLLNFAVFEFSTPMFVNIKGHSYIVFACCCAAITLVVYFYFPETKGKSLEEIDLIFGSDIGYYDVNSHHPQTAAATLLHMEKIQKKNANMYPFPLSKSSAFTPSEEPVTNGQNDIRQSDIVNENFSRVPPMEQRPSSRYLGKQPAILTSALASRSSSLSSST